MKIDSSFSSFSVADVDATRAFYQDVLGLTVKDSMAGVEVELPGGGTAVLYGKDDHEPASFTVLNLVVDDIDGAVSDLKDKGVSFERYDGLNPDDDIARGKSDGRGPDIAWFKDPAGNILAVLEM